MPTATARLLTTACRLAGLALLPLAAAAQAPTITAASTYTPLPGSTLVITGTNLATTTAVTLNGLTMPLTTAATAVAVTVKVPYEASIGKLRLTTSLGTVLSSQAVRVQRGSSAVKFPSVSTALTSTAPSGGYSTPTVTDLDADGKIELVVGQGDGTLALFQQSAVNGSDFVRSTASTTASGLLKDASGTIDVSSYAKPTFADLDGNGKLDMLVGENYGTVVRYEQASAKSLNFTKIGTLVANPYGTISGTSANAGSYARPAVADLDGDGLLDLLVGSSNGTIRRYVQSAANAASFVAASPAMLVDGSGTTIDAGDISKPLVMDLDGDGILDLLVGNFNGDLFAYKQAAANATVFVAAASPKLTTDGTTLVKYGGYYSAPVLTDIDGNGQLDLILGGNSATNAAGSSPIYRLQQAPAAPLPVVLASFTGQAASAANQLSWITASELNSAYFAVERSLDGRTFAELGQVAAAGNSASTRSYQYLDAAAPAGLSYYRLRQVDVDGTVAYSPVVTLSRAAALSTARPQAFPTIFTDELSLALPGADLPQVATVALLTLGGQLAYTATVPLGAAPQVLPGLPTLAPGLYLLRVATATGTSTQRVSRQ